MFTLIFSLQYGPIIPFYGKVYVKHCKIIIKVEVYIFYKRSIKFRSFGLFV